jgi:hypothetical protein
MAIVSEQGLRVVEVRLITRHNHNIVVTRRVVMVFVIIGTGGAGLTCFVDDFVMRMMGGKRR